LEEETVKARGGGSRPVDVAALAGRVHPRLRRRLPDVVEACRRAGVERAVLFGSATEVDADAEPQDLDVVVRLGGPVEGRAARYFTLRFELEQASGLSVDLVEDEALTNPYLRGDLERTGVEIVAAA
jgi:predicted nucleotidyltransferase